jgi:hypothetical protein
MPCCSRTTSIRTTFSGDNASLDLVRVIAERLGPFDVALLSAGAAQTALVEGAFLTLTSELAAEAVRILGSPQTVALHFEGWAHYTQGADALLNAFDEAGLGDRLHVARPGREHGLPDRDRRHPAGRRRSGGRLGRQRHGRCADRRLDHRPGHRHLRALGVQKVSGEARATAPSSARSRLGTVQSCRSTRFGSK